MKNYTLVFHVPDHRSIISRSLAQDIALESDREESYYIEEVLTRLRTVRASQPDAAFSGLFEIESGEGFLSTEALLSIVAEHDIPPDNSFAQRYEITPRATNASAKRGSLSDIADRMERRSLKLWYENQADIPRKAKRKYKDHTLIFFDLERVSIGVREFYLHTDFQSAISKLLTDEPICPWEPIGVVTGSVNTVLSASDFDASPAVAKLERETQTASALAPVTELPRVSVTETMSEVLLREAVGNLNLLDPTATNQLERASSDTTWSLFLERVKTHRPLIVIETSFWELSETLGKYLAEQLAIPFSSAGRAFGAYGIEEFSATERLVLFDDSIFGAGRDLNQDWVRQAISNLATSNVIGLCVLANRYALPTLFRDHVDVEIELPQLHSSVRDKIFTAIFGPQAAGDNEDDAWARYVVPLDLQKIVNSGKRGRDAVHDLKARVERRLSNTNAMNAPGLTDIHGLGEAKVQAEELVADIKLAASGHISWSEVDKGMLLVGPPGTGKTMLARAVSKDTGLRFLYGSTSEWFSTRYISTHIAAIRNFFMEARRLAPTIAFIDEFDSIGNRQHDHGVNNLYVNDIVNTMLQELQGFEERSGVIVIAATNNPDAIDPALKRAGRLDQIIRIPLPNALGLEQIFEYYIEELRTEGLVSGDIDTKTLGRMTLGQTGADVEFYVRGARRRARKERRSIVYEDFVAEITGRPLSDSDYQRLSDEELRRTAIHEAGHAVMQLAGPEKGASITYISIVPRADGSLGFVASFNDRTSATRDDIYEYVRVALGGRAAEEVTYGKSEVSTGSGGSARSDLAQATHILLRALYQHGYSESSGLVWYDVDKIIGGLLPTPPEIREELNKLLDTLYREAVSRLKNNQRLLKKVASVLMERQELTGDEVRTLVK